MRFSDGMSFNTSGPLRTVRKSDGLYVVGNGLLIPVNDYDEAKTLIEELSPKAEEELETQEPEEDSNSDDAEIHPLGRMEREEIALGMKRPAADMKLEQWEAYETKAKEESE